MSWTPAHRAAVDAAILNVARRNRLFTADDVWAALGAGFPVTKGLAARLSLAASAGAIRSTGSVVKTQRPIPRVGRGHNHGQRLTVWRSHVYQGV
jgi:hypothetical protein